MLKTINFKRNPSEEELEIKINKINFIYGSNGTGKTTTSNQYLNREIEGIYTFNQKFVNDNLFFPSSINGVMDNKQSAKFTEIMFGKDLIEIEKKIKEVDTSVENLDTNKRNLLDKNFSDEKSKKLEESDYTKHSAHWSFGIIIKSRNISDEIENFLKLNKISAAGEKLDESKIIDAFLLTKDNIANYIKNRNNNTFQESISSFNELATAVHQKIISKQIELQLEIEKWNNEVENFKKRDQKIEELNQLEAQSLKFVLDHSINMCYICENHDFNKESDLFKAWEAKINSKISKIKGNIINILEEIAEKLNEYNEFIKRTENSFKNNAEVRFMNDQVTLISRSLQNIRETLSKNGSLPYLDTIQDIKIMEKPSKIEDNLENILLLEFEKELKEYLNILAMRELLQKQKIKLKSELNGFEPMEHKNFKMIKKILKSIDFKYKIKLKKIPGQLTKMGINSHKLIIDEREVQELSMGERNILALAFFLSIIYNKLDDSEEIKTILIDDPVDSNDSGKIGLIIQEFRNLGNKVQKIQKEGSQWIYLTHNSELLFGSIEPKRSNDIKIINLSHKEPWFHEIEGKNDISKFMSDSETFLYNVLYLFINKPNDKNFVQAFCVFPKYAEMYEKLLGKTSAMTGSKKYKKILDYNQGGEKQDSKSISFTEFKDDFLEKVGFDFNEINPSEINLEDITLKKIRDFYGELDNWNPRENFVEDLFDRNIRYIARATFCTYDEKNGQNRVNNNVVRHSSNAYKPMFHINEGKI